MDILNLQIIALRKVEKNERNIINNTN